MASQFNTLFSFSVNHEYYGGLCPDFRFFWTADSLTKLKRGRLLSKVKNRVLHCLYATDDDGDPEVKLAGEKVVIALQLTNSNFSLFTQLDQTDRIAFYSNTGTPQVLSLERKLEAVASILTHVISQAERPVTLSLKNDTGGLLDSQTITSEAQTQCNFLLQGQQPGLFFISESYLSSPPQERYYYYEAELNKAGVFAIVEITLDQSLYQNAAQFSIDFSAREDTLKYYLVAKNYSDSDFDQLTVSDQGFSEQSRSKIEFDRVASSDFSMEELDAGLLGDGSDKIALFKSQIPVKRRQSAFKRIQLARNGDVLIANLPVPAQDKVRMDFIIHLARP